MGCHTWYYEILENITFKEIEDLSINNLKKHISEYSEEDLKNNFLNQSKKDCEDLLRKIIIGKGTYYEVLGWSGIKRIGKDICKEVNDNIFLFRTFNYNDEPLYSLEDTIMHIDKYYKNQNKLSFKTKRLLFLLGIKIKIWYYEKFKSTSLEYTHTHYRNGTIELNGSYDNTIEKVKEFWNKYPNAVIQFG